MNNNNNKPIRILQWGLFGGVGGIETFIMNLYRHIDKSKVQFDFLEAHDMEPFRYEEEINEMGGHVYRILYSERENYKKSKTCLVDFLKEHPEIQGIHVHANFPYGTLLKYAKEANLPIRFLHSHNSSDNDSVNVRGLRKIKYAIRSIRAGRQIKKYPTHYLACSDRAAEYMFPDENYIWIKNGVDLNRFDFNPQVREEVRKDNHINNDTKVIGFVGHLRTQKNPMRMLEIFNVYHKKNCDSVLWIIGIGELEEDMRNYVSNNSLDACVKFLGQRTDVERLYQAFDGFLLPSIFEGLPVVLVEAQAAGLPCFVSDVQTRQVQLTNEAKYISLDESNEQWAEVMESTLKNYVRKSNYKLLREAEFDIEDTARNIEALYYEILER